MKFSFIKKNGVIIFFFFSFLILGILITTNYFSSQNLENDVLNQYYDHRDSLLDKSIFNIEKEIGNKKLELKIIEKKIILNEIILNSCEQNIFNLNSNKLNYLENYFLINKKGTIIACSSNEFKDYLNLNVGNTNYFKEFINLKKPLIKIVKNTIPAQIYILSPILNLKQNNNNNVVATLSIIDFNSIYTKYLHELVKSDNLNYYYIYDRTNNEIYLKSEHLTNKKIKEFSNISAMEFKIINLNSKQFIFNKKEIRIGNNLLEIGLFSNTEDVNSMFKSLNLIHLISIFFIFTILIIIFIILINISKSKENAEKKLETANLLLKKYNINLNIESEKILSLSENELSISKLYFVRDDKDQAFELFVKEISKQKLGLCFLKGDITNFKTKYNLHKTSFIHLSDNEISNSMYKSETNIELIYTIISKFLQKNSNIPKIIYIDSIDYLILKNNFKLVLKVLYDLKEKIKSTNDILLFSINQNVISQRELLALENEFIDIETEEKKSLNSLSQLEIDILIYINSLNNNKIKVRYKDISIKFNITKPTTSKKIKDLEKDKFVIIKDVGRNKLIEITQKGRTII